MSDTEEQQTNNLQQDESLHDELDFYDFLEAISDKVDSISQQIEEKRKDSRQRWQRAREEVIEQRQLLRQQLQRKIRVWSDKVKKPTFIRTRDKISFSIGVANACFSPLIAGRWPDILPLVYTVQALFLITLRFFIYKRKSWHYFLYDLCYFVNLLTIMFLWIFPSSQILFMVCYLLSHGPVGLAIVLWRNSLVFHSLDKVTSLFIHMYPPLTLFTLRWILPDDLRKERYPAIDELGASFPVMSSILYTVLFYSIWQFLYCIFIVYGRREKVIRGLRATSYTWLLNDKDGFVSTLIRKFGVGGMNDDLNSRKIVFYFFLQFLYMLLSILPVSLWLCHYKYINVLYLCIIFGVSVYNGASFYIDVFSHRYIKSLELLQDQEGNHGTEYDAQQTDILEDSMKSTSTSDASPEISDNKKDA